MSKHKQFMVLVGPSGSVFVKERDFFVSQGGDKESWGKSWIPLEAESIEHARELGCSLPGARPYEEQA